MSTHPLEPSSLFGKSGRSFDYALDQCKFVVMPHSLESQRRARRCQVYEDDAAWRRFHHGGVDQRHAASPRQVAPDRVARGLFIDPGLEAGSAAVTDDGVEQARGHFAGPDLKQSVGDHSEFDSLAPCEPVCSAEANSQRLAPHYSRVEAPRVRGLWGDCQIETVGQKELLDLTPHHLARFDADPRVTLANVCQKS